MRFEGGGVPRVPPPGDTAPRLLYLHIPFCERLCPYCSFNRVVFEEELCRDYFRALRKELLLYRDLGYDFGGIYVGGGTPTVLIDELDGDDRPGAGLLSHPGAVGRNEPEPPDGGSPDGPAAGGRQPALRRRPELRRRPAQEDGPVRQVRERRGDRREAPQHARALRDAQRRHDLQFSDADPGDARPRPRHPACDRRSIRSPGTR